jgi:RNase H-like domain found in reverse transcriptase
MVAVNMKLNPTKSFFDLSGGKFLGFIVFERGIEIHSSKCQAITSMQPPKIAKEELTGHVAALARFIARSRDVCLPFFKTLKKARKFEWDEECNKAFARLKEYLSNPPVLSRPRAEEILFLYLAATGGTVSAALIREDEKGQRSVHYFSHILRDAET